MKKCVLGKVAIAITSLTVSSCISAMEKSSVKAESFHQGNPAVPFLSNILLHKAVAEGKPEVIENALRLGARIDSQDRGKMQPIHKAEDPGIIELLVKHGANVNAPIGSSKILPIDLAAEKGNVLAVESLLDNGALIDCQEEVTSPITSFSPIAWAIRGHNQGIRGKQRDVVILLVVRGACIKEDDEEDIRSMLGETLTEVLLGKVDKAPVLLGSYLKKETLSQEDKDLLKRAFLISASRGEWALMKMISDKPTVIDDNFWIKALYYAYAAGQSAIIENISNVLIKEKQTVLLKNALDYILYKALLAGEKEIVQMVLKVNVKLKYLVDTTPLQEKINVLIQEQPQQEKYKEVKDVLNQYETVKLTKEAVESIAQKPASSRNYMTTLPAEIVDLLSMFLLYNFEQKRT